MIHQTIIVVIVIQHLIHSECSSARNSPILFRIKIKTDFVSITFRLVSENSESFGAVKQKDEILMHSTFKAPCRLFIRKQINLKSRCEMKSVITSTEHIFFGRNQAMFSACVALISRNGFTSISRSYATRFAKTLTKEKALQPATFSKDSS